MWMITFRAILLIIFCVLTAPASADFARGVAAYKAKNYKLAYGELLPLAEANNPSVQNFIGFMLYHGEGVEQNNTAAHRWFHLAADQGHVEAMRNLGVLHSKGGPGISQNFTEANLWFLKVAENTKQAGEYRTNPQHQILPAQLEPVLKNAEKIAHTGERVFTTFCSGCHGFSGIAAYPLAPSVAFGDRMYKDDNALIQSVLDGKGRMPSWRNKLSEKTIAQAVGYMRALAIQFRQTKKITSPNLPKHIFRFRAVGQKGEIWWPSPYQ